MRNALTFVLCYYLSGVNFKFNCGLYQGWVILHHLVKPVVNEVFLDKVAHIVQS